MRIPATIGFLFCTLLLLVVGCGEDGEVVAPKDLSLDALIEKYPDSVELLVKRGRENLTSYAYDLAMSDAAKAYRLDSTNLEVERFYADVLNNRPTRSVEDVYVAQRHFKSLLKKDPKNTDLLVSLASTFSQQQDFDQAFKYINNALKINPKYRDAYILKGSIYRVLGNIKLMKSSYETAVQQDPKFYEAYLMLGVIYQQEQNPICIQYFTTAHELRPDIIEAFYSLAYAKQHFGQEESAKEMYREMVKDTSDFYASQAYFQLASMQQFLARDFDSALYFYSKATSIEPSFYEAYHNTGVCYDMKGDKTRALQSFGKALKNNPEFTLSREYADSIRHL
jgi:tetratricopeptide (TPR) repeat protein